MPRFARLARWEAYALDSVVYYTGLEAIESVPRKAAEEAADASKIEPPEPSKSTPEDCKIAGMLQIKRWRARSAAPGGSKSEAPFLVYDPGHACHLLLLLVCYIVLSFLVFRRLKRHGSG